MPLFNKKREEIKERIKPPTFPGLPEHNFPTYEPAFPSTSESIKRAVQGLDERPAAERPFMIPEERAIFVKVEKYKEAIDTLEIIKERLKTTQIILNELKNLKSKEDAQMEEWQSSIDDIKNKLMLIDNNLFEV